MTTSNKPCGIMGALSDPALVQVAEYFSALSEPTRLRMLNYLRDGERKVGELAAICVCSQANASRHLSILAKHGLVARESRGSAVYYQIADSAIYALCDLVCGMVAHQLQIQVVSLNSLSIKR